MSYGLTNKNIPLQLFQILTPFILNTCFTKIRTVHMQTNALAVLLMKIKA